jgi:triacylglycerol lipase
MVRKLGSLPVLTLILLVAVPLFAQDSRGNQGKFRLETNTHSHTGSSPFSPPDEDDTLFVVDSGSGLDTGCTYRSGGPLRINVRVKRVVGEVGGDGYLADPQGMIARGLISPKAKLILPVYDIDVNGAPGYPPEVDRVFFNGHDLGTLTGDNNIWKLNSFEVPIEWVKFPAPGANGAAPTPANNELRISIDEASGGQENWCMSVDWVQIQFGAVAPILLVHGTNADSSSWEPDFTAFFGNSRAPWSNDIDLTPNGSILGNGRELSNRVRQLAAGFGAKKVHLICHSKGGLDTRAYLNNHYDPRTVKVLSVYTLGTPHRGTIVSDIIVARRTTEDPESSDPDIEYLMSHDYWFLSTPQPPAINNQMTSAMAAFNATYPSVPSGVRFYNYGGDADLNNTGRISAAEALPLIPGGVPDGMASAAATAMYRAIGRIASISITPGTRGLWGLNHFTSIEVAATNTPFHENDLVTSVPSSKSPGGTYLGTREANHSSIKSNALAQLILNRIKSDYPIR